ncbi:MAG: hypothetical protein FJX33_13170 [Alphaproteobacteria bacterium]|nr:hypothetical protein [Alphaproteobacteria bacterium]
MPEPILHRLHAALAGALKDPQISQRLFDQGAVPGGNSRAEFGDFIRAEMAKWGEVIRRGNILGDLSVNPNPPRQGCAKSPPPAPAPTIRHQWAGWSCCH